MLQEARRLRAGKTGSPASDTPWLRQLGGIVVDSDLPTPAAEKAGLDAKGLDAAYAALGGRHFGHFETGLRAYLEATPDAQYRRGQMDMREAALNLPAVWPEPEDDFDADSGAPLVRVSDLRALPLTDHPAPSPWHDITSAPHSKPFPAPGTYETMT